MRGVSAFEWQAKLFLQNGQDTLERAFFATDEVLHTWQSVVQHGSDARLAETRLEDGARCGYADLALYCGQHGACIDLPFAEGIAKTGKIFVGDDGLMNDQLAAGELDSGFIAPAGRTGIACSAAIDKAAATFTLGPGHP